MVIICQNLICDKIIFGVCKLNHVHTVKTVLSALTDNNPEATVSSQLDTRQDTEIQDNS